MSEPYRSKVYTERPAYADFDAPAKFQAIQSIIAKRLTQHPKAICSYSGGADSDILLDLIERTREIFGLKPVKYAFFNTGLEMKATKDHVKAMAEKYGVEITEYRPKTNIVLATKRYGVPFVSKIMSAGLGEWQKKGVPLSIAEEYEQAEEQLHDLLRRWPAEQRVWLLRLELAARCHDGAGVRRVLRQAQAAGVWFDGEARRTLAFWQQEAAG